MKTAPWIFQWGGHIKFKSEPRAIHGTTGNGEHNPYLTQPPDPYPRQPDD